MPKLPIIKAKQLVTFLSRVGFVQHGKMKGSHLIMKHNNGRRTTVPMHSKDLPVGTFMAILRDIKISKEDFLAYLGKI